MIANKIASVDGYEYVMCVYDGDEWVREVCNTTLVNSPEEMQRLYDEYPEPPPPLEPPPSPPRNLGPPLRGAELRQGVDRVNRALGLS